MGKLTTEMIRDVYDLLFTVTKGENVSPEILNGMLEFEKRNLESSLADKIETITSELCSAGLLIPDPAGGSTNLRFPHKQFYEFLLAKAICINRSKESVVSSRIISKSSNEKGIIRRLRYEPHAIDYLAECNGKSISVILGGLDRLLTGITLSILSLALRVQNVVSKITFKSAQEIKVYANKTYSKSVYWEGSKFGYKLKPILLFLVGFVLLILSLKYLDKKEYFGMESDFVTALSEIAELIPESLILTPLISLIFIIPVALLSIGVGTDRSIILCEYLEAHLSKADQDPGSLGGFIDVARRSLIKNLVEFPNQDVEIETDSAQFLYPAKEFE